MSTCESGNGLKGKPLHVEVVQKEVRPSTDLRKISCETAGWVDMKHCGITEPPKSRLKFPQETKYYIRLPAVSLTAYRDKKNTDCGAPLNVQAYGDACKRDP